MLGLLLSTASGTISVTQFGNYSTGIKFGLNLVLTITSFAVALLTGIVKTFKFQENLEEYIHLKQSWVSFSAKISNEIYLPKKMRGNAETLIKDNKAKFLDLLKVDVPIPKEMSILAAKHLDKGDDIESQYYKYRENIIKNEKGMNQNYMKCLSFFFNCCNCFYKPITRKRILDNKELEKIIKYSKIENETKYKRRAYQYTLSSIMMNNVKREYDEVKNQNKKSIETQTQTQTEKIITVTNTEAGKAPIQVKLEETVAVVTSAVSKMMTPKKKEPVFKEEKEKEEKEDEEKGEKGEKETKKRTEEKN
jgi:Zn-finger nucleic acid-binding protein